MTNDVKWVIRSFGFLLSVLSVCRGQTTVFQYCDNTFNLNVGTTFLESPYYPNFYQRNTACRYTFQAPVDHTIRVTCDIQLDSLPDRCTTENFYVSTSGDGLLRDSENFCGTGQLVRQSLFNKLVLAYISQGSTGRFQCSLVVTKQPCDCGWSATPRIVNGQETGINEFPSMVAIRDKTTSVKSFCGGTIISHRYVMTAAHCAKIQPVAANLEILCGDHDLSSTTESLYAARYNVARIVIHPNYVEDPVRNDIALLQTTANIQWSRGVGPICIPPANVAANRFEYQNVVIAGWGMTSFGGVISKVLRKANVYTITNTYCQSQYSDSVIYNSQICTASNYNQDACQYDSGGPVILTTSRAFQLGIISFGRPCGTGSPTVGVNTRITSYGAWLNATTGYALCPKSL